MRYVQLWFSRPDRPNWFQRLIQWRQLGPWSHVRMAIPAGDRGYEVLESREGGVRQWFTQHAPDDVTCVVEVPIHSVRLPLIRGWWAERIGEAYDAVGIIEIAIGKAASNKTAWFCSEACCAALRAAGIFRFADPSRVTPQELWAMARARLELWQEYQPLVD